MKQVNKYKRPSNNFKNILYNVIHSDAINETRRREETEKEADSLAWCLNRLEKVANVHRSGSNYYGMWIDCFYKGTPLSFSNKRAVVAFLLSIKQN